MAKDIVPRDIKKNQDLLTVANLVNSGKSIDVIVKDSGFSRAKVQNMMRDNLFKAILAAQYKNAMSLTSKKLSSLYETALESLETIMECGDADLMLKGVAEVRKMIKQDHDMSKDDGDAGRPFEVIQTETTTKDPDGKVLSVQEQKQIVRKVRVANINSDNE